MEINSRGPKGEFPGNPYPIDGPDPVPRLPQQVKTQWLDGRHVVFGKVVDGMEVVQQVRWMLPPSCPAIRRLLKCVGVLFK